jgi:hypothetical protein
VRSTRVLDAGRGDMRRRGEIISESSNVTRRLLISVVVGSTRSLLKLAQTSSAGYQLLPSPPSAWWLLTLPEVFDPPRLTYRSVLFRGTIRNKLSENSTTEEFFLGDQDEVRSRQRRLREARW